MNGIRVDMSWCDPCAADPLSAEELRGLGVFWQEHNGRMGTGLAQGQNVYVTRLHVRYDAAHFPEDLLFQETSKRRIDLPFKPAISSVILGPAQMNAPPSPHIVNNFGNAMSATREPLAALTGWHIGDIRKAMHMAALPASDDNQWYQRLWNH
jgi:hypothetical protein